MGRRPGHLFHPAEGEGDGILFGHGPVFRDFNFDKDRTAANSVLAMRLPMTLVPYEVAREISLNGDDLAALEASGDATAWLASRAHHWLDFWGNEVGRQGFYPFDLLAGAYIRDPEFFDCARAQAWVSTDERLWNLWFYDPLALLVGLPEQVPESALASSPVLYCTTIASRAHDRLMNWLVGSLRHAE